MADNLHKEVERGAKADRVLAECDEYFVMVRQSILDTWADSPVGDAEGQHKLRLMLKLLEDVRGNIRQAALTGQMARIQIKEEEQRKSVAQRFLNRMGVRV
jgi:hypothetical protein